MQGLENAIVELLPHAEHRFCARHVYVNWASRCHIGEEMKQCFWRIAKSTTVRIFEENLKILADKKSKVVEDLLRVPPNKWCQAFFNTNYKIDLVDNNLCEAFNETLLKARKKPVISLFE